MLKGIRRLLKKYKLPYCWHKWKCVNYAETRKGYRAVYRCSRCNEYLV